jgi:hypothetical protein
LVGLWISSPAAAVAQAPLLPDLSQRFHSSDATPWTILFVLTLVTPVALSATDSDVRMDKVASIQAALASGTYNVPASAVASKMVDSMMGVKS